MAKNKRNRYKVWQRQSQYDLQAAHLSYEKGFFEWACYQSNQSVEKILKALLTHEGMQPPRSHKLGALLGMANHANKQFKSVTFDYHKIEAFTYTSRYPFLLPDKDKSPHEIITKDDAASCIQLADDVFNKVESFIESSQRVAEGELKEIRDYYFSEEVVENRKAEIIEQLLNNAPYIDPQKIIVFGRFAREKKPPKTSTMDLLIIANTDLRFIDRLQHVRDATRGDEPIVEPVVYTPSEIEYLLNEEGEGYVENAFETGKVLWEREN